MQNTREPPLPLTALLASLCEQRLELAVIDWVDAFGCPGGWEFEADVEPKVATVRTVGFVMKDTDEFVFVVPHVSTTKDRRQFAGHMAVPKKQIINMFQITSSCSDAEFDRVDRRSALRTG